MKQSNCSSRVVVSLFVLLSTAAFVLTWGMSAMDGTLAHMLELRNMETPRIPGTEEPLRLVFTGIPPLDYWLTIMVLFFWQAVDGSHPATSMVGIYFLGQLVGIWTLVWMEGGRGVNNGTSISRPALWAVLMQNLTLACFGPIYFIYSLRNGKNIPVSATEQFHRISVPVRYLVYLPVAILGGYIIPSIVISLPSPSIISYATQQAAIAIWTPFPLWVTAIHQILCWADQTLLSPKSTQTTAHTSQEQAREYLTAARAVYFLSFVLSAGSHITIAMLSLSTILFSPLFSASALVELSPLKILIPVNGSASAIGEGVLNFMQWDQWIGYTAALVWAIIVFHRGRFGQNTVIGWLRQIVITLGLVVMVGPGGAAVLLVWRRDERVVDMLLDVERPQLSKRMT